MDKPADVGASRSPGSGTPRERAISPRPSVSARRTFLPKPAAAVARAAATEDFPVPPFPDTITISRSNRSAQRMAATIGRRVRRIPGVSAPRRTALLIVLAGAVVLVTAVPVGAGARGPGTLSPAASADVVKVHGLIDRAV